MPDDNLASLEAEIASMQKTENKLEYISLVQQIIDAYNSVKVFIEHIPQDIRQENEETHIIDQLYLAPNGFKLGDLSITITQNEYLEITKDTEILFIFSKEQIVGDIEFIAQLSTQIKDLVSKFKGEIKTKIAEEKQRLIEKIKNF